MLSKLLKSDELHADNLDYLYAIYKEHNIFNTDALLQSMASGSSVPVHVPKSVRDLSPEQRADAESYFDDGWTPSEVAAELGLDLKVSQFIKKTWSRNNNASSVADVPAISSQDPATATLQSQIAEMELQSQKMRIQQQYDIMLERQQLINDKMRLDLRERSLRLEADYPAEIIGDEPPAESGDQPAATEYNFEEDPIGSVMLFIDRLKNKPQEAIRSSEIVSVTDPTKPLTTEQIDAEIARTSPEMLKRIQQAIGTPLEGELREGLRKKYPGITEQNLNLVLLRLNEKK